MSLLSLSDPDHQLPVNSSTQEWTNYHLFYPPSQARNYSEALQWYNYSLSFFKTGQMDSNLAKLQRNRASCFLQLKQLEKVKEPGPRTVALTEATAQGREEFNENMKLSFIRPKKLSRKQSGAILTAFSHTSAFTSWQWRRTMQRKVSAGHQRGVALSANSSELTVACFCNSCKGSECDRPPVQEPCDQRGQTAGVRERCVQSPQIGCSDRFGG